MHQKLGDVSTLYDRKNSIVTGAEGRIKKDHINSALKTCGYPESAFCRVKDQISHKKEQKTCNNKNATKHNATNTEKRPLVVLHYIQGTNNPYNGYLSSTSPQQ